MRVTAETEREWLTWLKQLPPAAVAEWRLEAQAAVSDAWVLAVQRAG